MLHVGCMMAASLLMAGVGILGWAGLKGGEVFIRIGERQLGRTERLRAGER